MIPAAIPVEALASLAELPVTPPTDPSIYIVYRKTTKEIVDYRHPVDADAPMPKGCAIAPVAPGGWRSVSDGSGKAEPWPADA